MPNYVFGNSSYSQDNKIDTSLFVHEPFLRTIYKEANIEEDIDLKNQYRFKNVPDPISIREAASKNYVDNKFTDRSIKKSNNPHADIELNFTKTINVGLIEVNSWPKWGDQVTSKPYVDNTIGNNVVESTLLRLDTDEKWSIDEQDCIILNSTWTSSKTTIEVTTKNYVDKKFDVPGIMKNTNHIDFNDKNLDNVRFIEVNRFPAIPEHLTAKIYLYNALSYSVDEWSFLTIHPEEKLNLYEQDSIIPNSTLTSSNTRIELPTKNYVDSLHESSNRRDLSSVFNHRDNEFVIRK